ncbi:type IV secretory system conjugative DNA transfer family protein, partial [Oscillibacter valericigenes]|nr:type IV secretory system conjugative DNA transfer family protein [Oscillibacter valericigenes]
MDYREFLEQIKKDLSERLSGVLEGATVDTTQVDKLQGRSYEGLSIVPEGSIIGLTMDLQPYFQMFNDGISYENIVEQIADRAAGAYADRPAVTAEDIGSYEAVKDMGGARSMTDKARKLLILNLPYVILGLIATNFGEAWRLAEGADISEKLLALFGILPAAFQNPLPSFHPLDLLIGLMCGAALRLAVYLRGKNAKKYRHNVEYGSARWGTAADIAPFIAPKFEDNIILTKTERLMMSNRPKNPANARNKNVLIVGGSGSGKTRFWLKPNLLQCHSSYVVTDPKGSIVCECGNALLKHGYRIKIFNTINFQKSMRYNPFAYLHSEKDILKLVTTLIANTKGDGKSGDEFWTKAETLLYTALIGYIHYEAPEEEQNFATLIEFINAMEVREDDEEFQNPVDMMFEDLKKRDPNHFAVRQYAKYKLAAGVVCSKRLLNQAVGKSLRTHNLKPKKGAQVMRKNEKITALYE